MRYTAGALKLNIWLCLRIGLIASIISLGLMPLSWNVRPAYAEEEAVKTIRVATSGTDATSCGSESSPCKSVQYAANRASSGDTILVAGGTYAYTSSADTCSFLTTRAVVCFVDKHLNIIGGYSANNWSTPYPDVNQTVIEGNGSYRGVAIVAYNSTASLHMENFTIQNGLAQGNLSGDAFGGGMWGQNSAVSLRNVSFLNNRAVGIDVSNNDGVSGSGGGLAVISPKNSAASTLENVSFEGNLAKGGSASQRGGVAIGGALFLYEAPLSGNFVNFINNTAQGGTSMGALGGAVGVQYYSSASFSNVIAQGNQALGGDMRNGTGLEGGGGLGGAFHVEQSDFTLTDAIVTDNLAKGAVGATGGYAFGGGIMTDTANSTISRAQVNRNVVTSGASNASGEAGDAGGGGFYLANFWSASNIVVNLYNTIVGDNIVQVGTPGHNGGINGAGITVQAITANINHCTIVNNNFVGGMNFGQAIAVLGEFGSSGKLATANINYSVIANHINTTTSPSNPSAVAVYPSNTANFNRGLFSGNTKDTNANDSASTHGKVNGLSTMTSVSSVEFVSTGGSDNNYHLTGSSPAINLAAGSSLSDDIDGDARPVDNVADLGADEYVEPILIANPLPVVQIADPEMQPVSEVLIELSSGADTTWTATTTADWLYLGQTGRSRELTGQTGETISVRFSPDNLDFGTHTATIEVTTIDGIYLSIPVEFIKVENVYGAFLPTLIK